MYLARYYIKREKWIPAINRYKNIIDKYQTTIFIEEALHRLVEIHYRIGLIEESKKTASVLAYNYPKSKWYQYSYNLVGDNNLNQPKKNNFFKRILNKISSNNEKK